MGLTQIGETDILESGAHNEVRDVLKKIEVTIWTKHVWFPESPGGAPPIKHSKNMSR